MDQLMIDPTYSTGRITSPCPGCGGSGQSSFFAGESRFMLTWEDCPDCCGTGVLLDDCNDSAEKIVRQKVSAQDGTKE